MNGPKCIKKIALISVILIPFTLVPWLKQQSEEQTVSYQKLFSIAKYDFDQQIHKGK